MPKSVNTYIKGLNKDNSRSKYDPSNYYDALNIKVITNGGLSTGSVETEKGNKLSFTIPNIPETTYEYINGNSETVPEQTNLRIIGWCTVSNYVVLFTTTLGGGVGQIWRFQYEEKTDTIITTGGGASLNVDDHLIYNNSIGLSINHRIEAEGRYENNSKIHVYWTDNFNPLRSINILDPNSFKITPGDIDITPNLVFCQPTVEEIGFGGSLPAGGKVQYAYRLVSENGAQTIMSPTSQLVTLNGTDSSSEANYIDVVGSAADSENTRSVTFNLKGIDTSYEIIHHIAILYTVKDAPTIFKFGEDGITSDEMSITLSGNEPRIQLTEPEFSATMGGFERCKTLAAKGNRLVIGNISTASIEIPTSEWDARAYRFMKDDATGFITADLYDASGALHKTLYSDTYPTGPNYDSIPEDADAINLFNHEETQTGRVDTTATGTSDWSVNQQFKYKTDGVTLGGEGKNISYTFVYKDLEVDKDGTFGGSDQRSSRQRAPFVNVDRANITENTGMFSPNGNPLTLQYTNVFPNFSDPYVETLYTGYTRGEVYRFGIEFYLKKGHTTFVKWIGDIKFPEAADDPEFAVTAPTNTYSGKLYVRSIGIQFTIDISDIKDKIGGFRILRAERPISEMTKLGTGFLLIANRRRGDNDTKSGPGGAGYGKNYKYVNSLAEAVSKTNIAMETGINKLNINGMQGRKANRFHLPDFPGFNRVNHNGYKGVHLKKPETKNFTIFISPLTIYKDTNQFVAKEGDYIKTNGYYTTALVQYQELDGKKQFTSSWAYYSRAFELPAHNPEYFKIDKTKYIGNGVRLNTNDSFIPDSTYDDDIPKKWESNKQNIDPEADFVNTTYSYTTEINKGIPGQPFGIGNNIYLMTLEDSTDVITTKFTEPKDMDWNNNVIENEQRFRLWDNGVVYLENNSIDTFKYKEVAWSRPLVRQYGGDSYEARSKQQYMSTGHFQPITSAVLSATNNGQEISPRIFGGDTYVAYWGRTYIDQYYNLTSQNPAGEYEDIDSKEKRLGVTAIVPVESYININLGSGKYFLKDRNGSKPGDWVGESYNVDQIYSQQNNSEDKFFAKDFAADFSEEFPHRLWASEEKIDGEPVDAWRNFKVANILDVEGSYGPINKVINFQDKLFYYQDRAFGIAAINERSVITDNSGVQVTLGTGDVLQDFRYVSTATGTRHQFSVVASTGSLYHYDATLRKLYKMSPNGQEPISDLKGLSNFFADNVDGEIIEVDKTLREVSPTGVHSTFDHRNNRALFTFLNPKTGVSNFTVSYNEMMGAFESFYSFVPNMYLNTGRRIISTDPNFQDKSYVHNEGIYGQFYGTTYKSHITLLVAPNANIPKIFTNIEYNSEISLNDVQQPSETLTELEVWNDYQTTGNIPLIVGTNIKRRIRHWRHVIGRDTNSSSSKARIRDYSVYMKLSYSNNTNKRLVLHDIMVSYTPARD
tara:strand:+ start:403 stop:4731 length:4329 start_codon:yes stop_codon:yes gene_type:complete